MRLSIFFIFLHLFVSPSSSSSFTYFSWTTSILSRSYSLSIPNAAKSRVPEFHDPTRLPVWHYVREYPFYLDVSHFTDICANQFALSVCDHHTMLRDTDFRPRVKCWLQYGAHGMSVSCSVGSEAWCPLFGVTNRSNMETICRRLCSIMMGRHYPERVRH